ncbi:putative chromosome segregation protein SudA [Fimicolochytrium jonesii]|uniref:putative chromosome segregation protein SudA n=1 Tax=Fimicolochytrium jonesii TaxID=1396493 RepID=UPI0022FF0DB6|nr:putative chromosome segregation protein SudA [Fimicolochytrium jonesii]KAI8824993.1 putative chromosome segregation protein SudA [Fimicolochytrium jonesii]
MYIKQIIIQGFKSYKDQTALEPFSPHHNVVVGRNGSGKSNFFWAIRFVLSDAYSNMTREERQALLHEGTGPATLSAFVEVVFDNSDQRFPTGKTETTLRRTIGLKKDEYALDKKSVPKQEVMSLFETAGFSRSNPYYIVPQGRITALTNAKDAERLQLLKEVAGTRVYEQRRTESLKIMEDTDHKRGKIDELLEVIEERLNELEAEKEELKQFQDLDRERRCLEYTIYTREQNELNESLEELEEAHRNEVDDSNQRQQLLHDRDAKIATIDRQIRDVKGRITLLQTERLQVEEDREEYIKAKAHLELIVKDLEENAVSNATAREKLVQGLQALKTKVVEKQGQIDTIRPQFEEALQQETDLTERKNLAELERTNLYAKQGRTSQFKTKAERDTYLKKELKTLRESKSSQEQQITDLKAQIESHREEEISLDNKIEQAKGRAEERKAKLGELEERDREVRRERNALDESRKELWRAESRSSVAAQTSKEEADQCERGLYTMMDRVTAEGLRSVQRIVTREKLRGVYGPLHELFEVDKTFQAAVEVIAGGSLWHVVVDNDETASTILRHMARERGRVTFMPLNRLHPKNVNYPQSNDAVVMINKLRFDERYRPAFAQVFGKALICPNLEVASGYSKSQNLDAVTLHGDRIERKGAITGGFHDNRKSKLETIAKLKEFRKTQETEEAESARLKNEITRVDQEITKCRGNLAELDAERRKLASAVVGAGEVELITREKETLGNIISRKELSMANLKSGIRNIEAQITAFTQELSSPFSRALNDQELERLEALGEELVTLEEQLGETSKRRAKLESRKKILEFELSQNLLRREADIRLELENLGVAEVSSSSAGSDAIIEGRKAELAGVEANIIRCSDRIAEIDAELEERTLELRKGVESLENARNEQQSALKTLEKHRLVLEKYVSKKTSLMQRKEECMRSIRELGVLPDDAWERFEGFNGNKLLKRLHSVNEKLKKYSHVNKKAFEQYVNFTKQRDSLEKRKDELDSSAGAIEELISNLDQRKDEAIQRTFTQVAAFFKDVWSKLVPGGNGELIMLRRADGSSQTQDEAPSEEEEEEEEEGDDASDDDEEETSKRGHKSKGKTKAKGKKPVKSSKAKGKKAAKNDRLRSTIDQYTGVSISLTFEPSQHPLRMPQLSGGQKSLVALALIFAIQRCDPAPFYLFDEIDAALDAQYRTAVAAMIHALSPNAQFITTTFRPELLVNAEKFYGVTFVNKVSRIQSITRDDAKRFVEETANPNANTTADEVARPVTATTSAKRKRAVAAVPVRREVQEEEPAEDEEEEVEDEDEVVEEGGDEEDAMVSESVVGGLVG